MHKTLTLILPHIFFLFVLFSIPSQYALYVFTVFYVVGIYINYQKEKKHAEELKKKPTSSGDWWHVLGTDKTASVSECARVRKLLAKIYHPDSGQAPNAEHMQRINEAFEERSTLPETTLPYGMVRH